MKTRLTNTIREEFAKENFSRFKFDLLVVVLDILAALYISAWLWSLILKAV